MDFADIEDAVKAAVKASLPYVRTVETYAGQLEGEIDTLTMRFPAVFVAYGGSALDWVDGKSFSDEAEFSVIVAARGLRGKEGLRRGEHGCYRMIKDVLAALAGRRLGLEAMEPMKPAKVSLLFISEKAAAYEVAFQTRFDTDFGQSAG